MDLLTFLQWSVFICFIYLIAVNAAFLLMLIGSALEHRLLVRREQTEDYETLAQSRFTIPVSVIAPAFNEALVIESSVKSMLELQYPEFEIIVVNDGSRDRTQALADEMTARHPGIVRAVHHPTNLGYGAALQAT